MKALAIGTFAMTLLAAPMLALSAEQAAVEEKLGPGYALTMEGMT